MKIPRPSRMNSKLRPPQANMKKQLGQFPQWPLGLAKKTSKRLGLITKYVRSPNTTYCSGLGGFNMFQPVCLLSWGPYMSIHVHTSYVHTGLIHAPCGSKALSQNWMASEAPANCSILFACPSFPWKKTRFEGAEPQSISQKETDRSWLAFRVSLKPTFPWKRPVA